MEYGHVTRRGRRSKGKGKGQFGRANRRRGHFVLSCTYLQNPATLANKAMLAS